MPKQRLELHMHHARLKNHTSLEPLWLHVPSLRRDQAGTSRHPCRMLKRPAVCRGRIGLRMSKTRHRKERASSRLERNTGQSLTLRKKDTAAMHVRSAVASRKTKFEVQAGAAARCIKNSSFPWLLMCQAQRRECERLQPQATSPLEKRHGPRRGS